MKVIRGMILPLSIGFPLTEKTNLHFNENNTSNALYQKKMPFLEPRKYFIFAKS